MYQSLHDRISRVINTIAFEQSLEKSGFDLFDFQCDWNHQSHGDFSKLCPEFQAAILAGEEQLASQKCVELVA